ncbi:methylated-DNA--[protein]-cysteine S-methyltransferase [Paraburkholderia sp. CNPSo 3157]|uniref:Methylated-DNA--protein-cysteine methyltransferase n=1 Tax=Paraburkholderia franconis TaxID=2654983 RepID=A0A7X1TDL0_9BURK|nr:methylated-DNA--[protein]-cysteine S-methyltransferase [Paraburkholderia franconis]MPW15405.1 methylated-DNA--[protein]-cysteine S-methyltransferase [Paraburkholderia franconis]
MKQCMSMPSPLGDILLRAEDDALTGVFFVGQKYFPAADAALTTLAPSRVLHQAREQLGEYFVGERQQFTLRLRMLGSAFQRDVWEQLVAIPYGETASYGSIARRLGLPLSASRAVGAANGRNPISIVVPCHRVISSAGDLTGYAGGLHRKEALLTLERPMSKAPQQLELLAAD